MDRALQAATYDALTGDAGVMALVKSVKDNPVQVADPEDNSPFPYITIGDDVIREWDDSCRVGGDSTSFIHVWSRASHQLEAKDIIAAIRTALHRQPMVMAGYDVIGVDMVQTEAQRDPDGRTIHGVAEFRIVFVTQSQ